VGHCPVGSATGSVQRTTGQVPTHTAPAVTSSKLPRTATAQGAPPYMPRKKHTNKHTRARSAHSTHRNACAQAAGASYASWRSGSIYNALRVATNTLRRNALLPGHSGLRLPVLGAYGRPRPMDVAGFTELAPPRRRHVVPGAHISPKGHRCGSTVGPLRARGAGEITKTSPGLLPGVMRAGHEGMDFL
jgi:hypothetical protein